MNMKEKNTTLSAFHPQIEVNGKPYPYVGIYESSSYTGNLQVWEQFNTRFQCITQLPRIGLIASLTLFQWQSQRRGCHDRHRTSETVKSGLLYGCKRQPLSFYRRNGDRQSFFRFDYVNKYLNGFPGRLFRALFLIESANYQRNRTSCVRCLLCQQPDTIKSETIQKQHTAILHIESGTVLRS